MVFLSQNRIEPSRKYPYTGKYYQQCLEYFYNHDNDNDITNNADNDINTKYL